MTLENWTRYSRVVSFFVSASFISLRLMPGIKGCNDVRWHTSSYLMVLLCTHPWVLPWRPLGSEGGMPVCTQMLRVALRSTSIRHVNGELRQHLPPSPCHSLLSLQSSKRGAAELPKHTGSKGELGSGHWFCMQPTHDCVSQPGVRPLNPHWGLDLL